MKIVQLVFISLLLSACLEDPDCIITSSNLVKISFKEDEDTSKALKITKIKVSGSDSTYYAGLTVSSVQLPLNPGAETSVFTFEYEGVTKTIDLEYVKTSTLVSPACGVFIDYNGLLASSTTFDSLIVINNQLSTNVSTNIEIFIE